MKYILLVIIYFFSPLLSADSSISSLVVNENGVPVYDAKVTIGNWHIDRNTISKSAITDKLGTFFMNNLKEGLQSIRIECSGFMLYEDTVNLEKGLNRKTFTIIRDYSQNFEVDRILSLSGKIISKKNGRAIRNASITVKNKHVFSNSKGRFKIHLLKGVAIIIVNANGYKQLTEKIIMDRSRRNYVFRLKPIEKYVEIKGKVVENGSSMPLSNVKITIGKRSTKTNSNGEYKISDLSEGNYYLKAFHKNYEPFNKKVHLYEGRNIYDIIIDISNLSLELTGTVLYYASGEPVRNAKVVVGDSIAITDNNGEYILTNVKFGKRKIIILKNNKCIYNKVINCRGKVQIYDILIKK